MPNSFNINSSDTENGYIYKELNSRMISIEKELREVNNLFSQVTGGNTSVVQLSDILDQINKRAKIDYVSSHIQNNEVHINGSKSIEWDAKYRKPADGIPEQDLNESVQFKINTVAGTNLRKLEYKIGNNIDDSILINHDLNSTGLFVSIWDKNQNQVLTDVHIVNPNSIRVDFLVVPNINEYRVVIIG